MVIMKVLTNFRDIHLKNSKKITAISFLKNYEMTLDNLWIKQEIKKEIMLYVVSCD